MNFHYNAIEMNDTFLIFKVSFNLNSIFSFYLNVYFHPGYMFIILNLLNKLIGIMFNN